MHAHICVAVDKQGVLAPFIKKQITTERPPNRKTSKDDSRGTRGGNLFLNRDQTEPKGTNQEEGSQDVTPPCVCVRVCVCVCVCVRV